MREIKFRGKSAQGTWVYGNLTLNGGFAWIDNQLVNVDSVGQFTGLHDKDGKEVYEGDIIECVSWNDYFDDGSGTPEPFRRFFRVAFKAPAFVLYESPLFEGFQERCFSLVLDGDLTILGNLIDNPQMYGKN